MASYRNAWRCRRCPKSSDADGCPAWAEYVERQPETGAERIVRECVFQALPKLLIHTVAASHQAAATTDHHRNEVLRAVSALGVPGRPQLPAPSADAMRPHPQEQANAN